MGRLGKADLACDVGCSCVYVESTTFTLILPNSDGDDGSDDDDDEDSGSSELLASESASLSSECDNSSDALQAGALEEGDSRSPSENIRGQLTGRV